MLRGHLALFTDLPLRIEHAPVSRLVNIGRVAAEEGWSVSLTGVEATPDIDKLPIRVCAVARNPNGRTVINPFNAVIRRAVSSAGAVVVRGYWLGFFVLAMAWFRGVPLRMFDFHGSTWREVRDRPFYAALSWGMESIAFSLATHVLTVSEGVKSQVPKRAAGKCMVFENGVSPLDGQRVPLGQQSRSSRLNIPTDTFCIGVVARFGAHFELDTVCRALENIEADVLLVIVGEGPGLSEIDFGAHSNVLPVGEWPADEVRAFLENRCDAALLPYNPDWPCSTTPKFFASRKLMEYLAAGLPVLAPDIPGIHPVLRNHTLGFLHQPYAAEELASHILRLREDSALRKQICSQAKTIATEYSWANLARNSGFIEILATNGSQA